MYQLKIEKFEGPLHLLLQLIEQEELDITEVSLAQVTDQYLQYLDKIEEINPGEVADFLVIASKLLLIKSRLLLPTLKFDDEDDAVDLERQLKLYKEYLDASKRVAEMWQGGHIAYFRSKPYIIPKAEGFLPPVGLRAEHLEKAMNFLIRALEPLIRLPQVSMKKAISIQEKISHLKALVLQHVKLNWQKIMDSANDKTDIIVSFLAILELVKQKELSVEQEGLFNEITITKKAK